jgi:hypothetical protein
MKTRNGFVSNSSSASFVVNTNKLTEKQIRAILTYNNWYVKNKDCWEISLNDNTIVGFTYMNNGDLSKYLKKSKVPTKDFVWGD